jgi:hypothetical protein
VPSQHRTKHSSASSHTQNSSSFCLQKKMDISNGGKLSIARHLNPHAAEFSPRSPKSPTPFHQKSVGESNDWKNKSPSPVVKDASQSVPPADRPKTATGPGDNVSNILQIPPFKSISSQFHPQQRVPSSGSLSPSSQLVGPSPQRGSSPGMMSHQEKSQIQHNYPSNSMQVEAQENELHSESHRSAMLERALKEYREKHSRGKTQCPKVRIRDRGTDKAITEKTCKKSN